MVISVRLTDEDDDDGVPLVCCSKLGARAEGQNELCPSGPRSGFK